MLDILWDLDGTLIDSRDEILLNLNLALQDAGLSADDLIKPLKVGPTIDIILNESIPSYILNEEKLNLIIKYFRNRYDNSNFNATKACKGIENILSDTDSFKHHIITNKPDFPTNRIIEKMGWEDFIASITTPYSYFKNSVSSCVKKKDKVELFSEIILKYKGKKNTFVSIGDMKEECIAAKKNNIKSIGVTWGYSTREELKDAGFDFIVESIEDLFEALVGIANE